MDKEKNYFSHDLNARNDRKIAALVRDHKAAGYGIFWAACEMLHEEGGILEMDDITYSAIAKDLNDDFELVKKVIIGCIESYKLFFIADNNLTSNRVSRNLAKRSDISQKRRKAAFAKHLHASAEQMDANGMQTDTIAMQNGAKKERNKEIKKERKMGVRFSEDGKLVFFEDGSSQELGQRQQQRFREGDYMPHYIKSGLIE
jgi:hypothetical protein